MKIMDKNGRLFGKISVIDLLAVLVVIVMAFTLGGRKSSDSGNTHTVEEQDITYQLQVTSLPDYMADALKEGDLVHEVDHSNGGDLGEILSIERAPGTRYTDLDDGTYRRVPVEGTHDLVVTIKGRGIVSNGHVLLNRVYELGVNSSRNYYTPYVQFVGNVISIDY